MATINGTASGETLQGTAGDDIINGLGGDDTLYAGDGKDTVNGVDGDDDIYGATAGDVINGGAGTDWIDLNLDAVLTAITVDISNAAAGSVVIGATGTTLTQVETGYIYFGAGNDVVTLGTSRISVRPGDGNDTVTGGALASGAFNAGAAASQADDRIIYNGVTGALLFDVDGAGGAAGVQFATLTAGLSLTSLDFLIV